MNSAVFVDFENLYLSLKHRTETAGLRTRELALKILEGLLVKLRAEGHPMVLGRSYAAFDTYPGVEVAHDLALMGLEPQYVLISHTGKNSADVQLALDVARVVFKRPEVQQIVIVSGDRDFIPLARQVLEENRELRVVAIPDTTSGDLRARVGGERYWDALALVPEAYSSLREPSLGGVESAAGRGPVPRLPIAGGADSAIAPRGNGRAAAATPIRSTPVAVEVGESPIEDTVVAATVLDSVLDGQPAHDAETGGLANATIQTGTAISNGAKVVGHIPVTWKTGSRSVPDALAQCVELLLRARQRYGSKEIWLSPFLRGPMSQHFSHLVHPERRELINELRARGVVRVEERENQYAEYPYSVIVLIDEHPDVQAAMRG